MTHVVCVPFGGARCGTDPVGEDLYRVPWGGDNGGRRERTPAWEGHLNIEAAPKHKQMLCEESRDWRVGGREREAAVLRVMRRRLGRRGTFHAVAST